MVRHKACNRGTGVGGGSQTPGIVHGSQLQSPRIQGFGHTGEAVGPRCHGRQVA